MKKIFAALIALQFSCLQLLAQTPMDGGVWRDNTGKHITRRACSVPRTYSVRGSSCPTLAVARVPTRLSARRAHIYKVETAAQRKMFHVADYVFMADMWNPEHLSDSRHLWIPIEFENGVPVLRK